MSAFRLPEFPNGPVSVGIAAATDTVYALDQKIHYAAGPANDDAAVNFALARVRWDRRWNGTTNYLVVAAATWCIKNAVVDVANSSVRNSTAGVTIGDTEIAALPMDAVPIDKVVTLLMATKITYVMLNHHVGQQRDRVDGYAGKVLKSWGWDEFPGIKDAVWMIGHWLDTKIALNELGYPDISGAAAPRLNLTLEPDARLRITGGVAGAGKFLVYRALLERAKMSAYALLFNVEVDLGAVDKMYAAIRANPLKYHVGSQFLTGERQLESDIFTEHDKLALSAYIRVAAPESTLAHSPNVVAEADVAGLEEFTNMRQLKILLTKTESLAVVIEALRARGIERNVLAVKSGFITAEALAEAAETVDTDRAARGL